MLSNGEACQLDSVVLRKEGRHNADESGHHPSAVSLTGQPDMDHYPQHLIGTRVCAGSEGWGMSQT